MNRFLSGSLLLTLLLAPFFAVSATPISESREANADVHVRIENIAGSVEVRTGTGNRVEVTGSLGDGAKPLRIEGDGARMTIEVEPEGSGWGSSNMDDTQLIVTVPPGARIEVGTVSASVEVDGVNGSHAEVESVSGSIKFVADAQRVSLKSVSGNIDGQGAGNDWTVGTVSGRISLPRASGDLSVESVSGSIEFAFGQADRLRVETVSGRIVASGQLLPGGSVAMQSVSGSIGLTLEGAVDARINAKTFSGGIDSDFGTPESGGIGGGKNLETRVGAGSADIRLESFSGGIRISKGS
jgi:DUF4097 and DUF4098 domain-containing protein YvlB